MEKRRVLVCSAWPYASGVPHLGNLVSSLLSGDVFARYYRMRGHDVLYVSGTDAHGTRIEFEARQAGMTPAELADRNHHRIDEIIKRFGIAFDNYTTTATTTHRDFVQAIYLDMEANGYIVTRDEDRAYCSNCQLFLADRYITGTCPRCGAEGALGNQCDVCGSMLEPEELVDPACAVCGKMDIEFRSTRHWYLDLPAMAVKLREYVGSRGFQGNVRAFTLQMIEDGLRPRAMTRDIAWGIPAPFEGAEGKVIYVWGEAALGYVSSCIEHAGGDESWREFWFGDDVHQVYTLGKDNIPFHTVVFPGQLIASGRGYHLPDQIAATEYLNWIGGASFSKSRGVGLYCDDALELMDADLWRFYLLYNRPEGRDVNFSWKELETAVNGVLISNVANLINRILSFVQTRYEGVVPDTGVDAEVAETVASTVEAYETAMADGLIGQAVRAACGLAVSGNAYFQRKKPWETKDADAVASAFTLSKVLALLLQPITPRFSSAVLAVMGIDAPCWDDLTVADGGRRLAEERVLLERIDVEELQRRVDGKAEGPDDAEEGPEVERVSFDVFEKLDLRVGVIRSVEAIPDADRLYRLSIDVGTRSLTTVSGLRRMYGEEDLVGREVVVLTNLEPVTLKGVTSECMLLAAKDERISLVTPDREVPPGTPVA